MRILRQQHPFKMLTIMELASGDRRTAYKLVPNSGAVTLAYCMSDTGNFIISNSDYCLRFVAAGFCCRFYFWHKSLVFKIET